LTLRIVGHRNSYHRRSNHKPIQRTNKLTINPPPRFTAPTTQAHHRFTACRNPKHPARFTASKQALASHHRFTATHTFTQAPTAPAAAPSDIPNRTHHQTPSTTNHHSSHPTLDPPLPNLQWPNNNNKTKAETTTSGPGRARQTKRKSGQEEREKIGKCEQE
jgi:hypothetical protein